MKMETREEEKREKRTEGGREGIARKGRKEKKILKEGKQTYMHGLENNKTNENVYFVSD